MYYDVIEAKPLGHLRLFVRFSDGLKGEVRFKDSHLYGVFETLKNPDVFKQVSCNDGFVVWPGDIDLAPDAMYEAIQLSGEWVLA